VGKLWKACASVRPDKALAAFPDPYWLCRCERWQVFAPEGRVGSVRRMLYGSWLDMPEALLLDRGLFRKQTIVVSTEEVERVLPEQQRLILRRQPRPDEGLTEVLKRRVRARPAQSASGLRS
jgi:hypothetical protein